MKKVLKFSASWCGPCKMLSVVFNEVQTSVEIEEVDIDKNPELTSQYGVRGVPTLVMLEDGAEVKRSVGLLNRVQLENWLNS